MQQSTSFLLLLAGYINLTLAHLSYEPKGTRILRRHTFQLVPYPKPRVSISNVKDLMYNHPNKLVAFCEVNVCEYHSDVSINVHQHFMLFASCIKITLRGGMSAIVCQ